MKAVEARDGWVDYALAMADEAGRGSRDLSLIASRLNGISLDALVEERMQAIVRRQGALDDEDAVRSARSLFGELALWLLEFMVAASYVRQERGLSEEELSFAVSRWFSRMGIELAEHERLELMRSILVKSLLNNARPFLVARTRGGGVGLVEAPLLIRVEHGRYRVTDETENYLYHLDSTIDMFASDYSLVAARMGRELDSRSYGKSSRTVMEMISTAGHARLLMQAIVNDTGHLEPDEQAERYDAIRHSVDEIRKGDEIERRYREEIARIWEGWDSEATMKSVRERNGSSLVDLRTLDDGLRTLMVVKSWMYDEYATLSERCAEVTRHYLRSSIVTTLFSIDDLMDEVAHADLTDVGWLDRLLLPASRPGSCIAYTMPPLITMDAMFRQPSEETRPPEMSIVDMLDDDAEEDAADTHDVSGLMEAFAEWLKGGGGTLEDWLASREPEEVYGDMESYDLARLVGSLLIGSQGTSTIDDAEPDNPDEGHLHGFSDGAWLRRYLPNMIRLQDVHARKLGSEVGYLGSDGSCDVVGTLEDVRFEVTTVG